MNERACGHINSDLLDGVCSGVGCKGIRLGTVVASRKTGYVLGKVVHMYRDGNRMAFVKGADGKTYRYQLIDITDASKEG